MATSKVRDPKKMLLLVAVLFGGLSACLSFAYLRSQSATAEPVPTSPVVVAKQDIPSRAAITAAMLEIKDVPRDGMHPEAFQDVTLVVGKAPKYPIVKGEQVLKDKFVDDKADTVIAAQIPAGKRAIAVGVTEVVGTGGLLAPGDHVDVIVVFDKDKIGRNATTVVLQNIEVLAVGQSLDSRNVQTAGSSPVPNPNRAGDGPKSATLAVSLDEAQRLVLAEEFGKLRLAVRPPKDTAIIQTSERELNAIISNPSGGR